MARVIGAAPGPVAANLAFAAGDVWVAYPMKPAPDKQWVLTAGLALGAIGAAVQAGITGSEKGRVVRRKKP